MCIKTSDSHRMAFCAHSLVIKQGRVTQERNLGIFRVCGTMYMQQFTQSISISTVLTETGHFIVTITSRLCGTSSLAVIFDKLST